MTVRPSLEHVDGGRSQERRFRSGQFRFHPQDIFAEFRCQGSVMELGRTSFYF
jgi:hypothetical protein